MKLSTANFLLPGIVGLLPRALAANYQGGLEISKKCLEDPEFNFCPAYLPSRNALLLPILSHVVDESGEVPSRVLEGEPLVRAAFYFKDEESEELVEESTLTYYEMPEGFEDKQCSLQFISDETTNRPMKEEFVIWTLEGDGKDVNEETTWETKPARANDFARFFFGSPRECLAHTKSRGFFHKGPGYGNSNPTFPCPPPGRFAYEISVVPREDGTPNAELNQRGGSGLAIEILDVPSDYNDVHPEYPEAIGANCQPPPSGTATVPGIPTATETGTSTGAPAPPDSTGGAAKLSSFVGGAVMVAGLPLVI